MARNDQYDGEDDDQEYDPRTGEPVSPAVKQMRAHIKKLEKERDGLREKLVTLEPQLRTRALVDALTIKGVKAPAKIAKLIPSDVETSQEAVDTWLDEYADVLGVEQQASQEGESQQQEQQAADGQQQPPAGFTPEQMAALRQMDITQSSALPPATQSALEAKLGDPNLTEVELLALIANPASIGA